MSPSCTPCLSLLQLPDPLVLISLVPPRLNGKRPNLGALVDSDMSHVRRRVVTLVLVVLVVVASSSCAPSYLSRRTEVSSTLRFPTTFPCRFVSFVHRKAIRAVLSLLLLPFSLASFEKQNKREIGGSMASSMMFHVDRYRFLYLCIYIIT